MPTPSPLRTLRRGLRRAVSGLPRDWRFALYRRMVDCEPDPRLALEVRIADTREDLEASFALLHDAYVASGFMQPHPSGLRATVYHMLPTTTTVCARVDGRVVGTLSMVRESEFGLPLQTAFDLAPLRVIGGQVAEISALAVHPDYRRTGGKILFPLMKFMYQYCTRYFDTRHIVIAVNPDRIEMYESLLLFERLQEQVIESYAFANGAAAVGARLDLSQAPERFRRVYGGKGRRRDLHAYFTGEPGPMLQLPPRPYFTTNDPVMTPALLDHFFNQRTQGFAALDTRHRHLLREIYDGPEFAAVLPPVDRNERAPTRQHKRFSIRFPAELRLQSPGGDEVRLSLREISAGGCQVEMASSELALGIEGELTVRLGQDRLSASHARVVRPAGVGVWGLEVTDPDDAWQECVHALETSSTYQDLSDA